MTQETNNRLADGGPIELAFVIYDSVPARYRRDPKPEPTAKEPPAPLAPDWKHRFEALPHHGKSGVRNPSLPQKLKVLKVISDPESPQELWIYFPFPEMTFDPKVSTLAEHGGDDHHE